MTCFPLDTIEMSKVVGTRGRVASVSNAGSMQTGNLVDGWSPATNSQNGVVLQFGHPSSSLGGKKGNLWKSISKHIKLEFSELITIDNNDKDSLICELEDSAAKAGMEWYNIETVMHELPESWSLAIVNKTEDPIEQSGILKHSEILQRSAMVAVTGIEDSRQHGLALRIAEACRGFIRLDRISIDRKRQTTVAIIQVGPKVKTPAPLAYPSIAKILPKRMEIPPPKGVANDYLHITEKISDNYESWSPKIRISIVIPLYNRREMLGRTLAMISHQTYPLDLIEVVIADDGSNDDPLSMVSEFDEILDIQYVRQKDLGYRLSEVRNLGIRTAKNDYVILLDCDMAPVPTMVEAYARCLEVSTRSLFCGHRRYVDANHIPVSEVKESPRKMLELPDIETTNEKMKRDGHILDWRMPMYRQSDNLRFEKYPFRAVCGGNIGFHKSLFDRVGEFDESFKAWGKEDTEWGFRAWNRGEYIIPLFEACGLHMEPPGGRNETDRELGLEEVMPIFVDRVPVMYRKHEHGVRNSVPLVSIYIPAFNAEDSIVETVNSALSQTFEDIEVCIAVDGSRDGTLKQLEDNFLENPRVRWAVQENQGIGGASNTAVQLCRGVFIGQLDSDDLLLPEAVEIMLEEIQRDTRIGVVYGSFQKETPEGEFLEDGYDWPEYSREKLMHGCIVHHFRMFRARDWWRTTGFATDIKNAVDFDMFLKMSEVTEMKHVREWSYVYRIHEKSTSVSESDIQIRNHFISIQRSLDRRDLSDRWSVEPRDGGDSRQALFKEKKDWDKSRDTTTPFAKMESKLREAAPPIVKKLAKMEANKKPWSIHAFPLERVRERIIAYGSSLGIDPSDERLEEIYACSGGNLWESFDKLESLVESTNRGD